MKAKKKFGQNFLHNEVYKNMIIQSMPNSDNLVVEIGPGLGDLTEKLLSRREVVAYEIDEELCEILRNKFPNLKLYCGDVLDSWIDKSLRGEKYDLIANLPYYVATNIILKALKDENCENILVLIQKEVAEKFSANVGDKVFGSLGIIAQSIAKVDKLFDIEPEAFNPAPKVVSSVILFQKEQKSYDEKFADFLKIAFVAPRKTLIKNLSSKYSKDELLEIFNELELAQTIRPHQLTITLFLKIYEMLGEKQDGTSKK